MKKILALTFIIGFIGCSEMVDPPKYEYGDCITPTDLNASWYGEYAKVDGFVIKAKDTKGSAYALWFPEYENGDVLFQKSYIEANTKKVDYLKNCGLPS